VEISDPAVKLKMSAQITVTFEPVLDDVNDVGDSKDVLTF
jgi:hypothetical protein